MHERRPGTTVCLHCRHQARIAAQERRKRLMLRGSAVLVVAVVLGAAGMLGTGALRNRGEAKRAASRTQNVVTVAQSTDTQLTATQAASMTPATAQPIGVPTAATPAPKRVTLQGEVSRARVAPLAPIVAMGQSTLGAGITAVRDDSGIVLAFDTPETRTRIPEKFESFVRTTLPRLYGAAADSALARVPAGGIANSQKALLFDLPTRGIRIALPNGWWLVLYPEIRPGQDGPLVVRYRSAVVDRVS